MLAVALLGLLHLLCAVVTATNFWRPSRQADHPVTALLHAFLTFYGLPILIGWTTNYINTITILASAAVALAVAGVAYWRNPDKSAYSWLLRALRQTSWGERIPALLLVLYILITGFVGANLPLRAFDAVGYHSITPMAWAVGGRFQLHSFGDPHLDYYTTHGETFPNAKAVLPYIILWWTGGETGTALAQWPFLLLALAAIYAICRRLALSRAMSLIAMLFVCAAPEIFLQSTEGYADLQFFAGQMAVIWAIINIWTERTPRRQFILHAAAFAVVAGAKPNGILMCGVMGLLYLSAIIIRESGSVAARLRRAALALTAVLAVCLAIAGPWYLHAWSKFGNPVFPIKVAVGSHVIFPGEGSISVANEMWEEHMGATGIRAWWIAMNEIQRHPVVASWGSGLGAHALILGVPSLLLFLALFWRYPEKRLHLFLLIAFLLMFLASPIRVWPRMILFELALYGFAFCWCVERSTRWGRVLCISIFFLLAAYNGARTIPAITYRTRLASTAFFPFLTGHTRPAMVDTVPGSYTVRDYWRETIAQPGDLLAIPALGEPVWHFRPLVRGASVLRVPPRGTQSRAEWIESLRATGATHFHAPSNSPEFRDAMESPEAFELLMWRFDVGAEQPWNIDPQRESALFKIRPAS